jgi:hypothetical protein
MSVITCYVRVVWVNVDPVNHQLCLDPETDARLTAEPIRERCLAIA